MKEWVINLQGKDIVIFQDTDGKFIKPDFLKEYEKLGTALKPAHEPVIVARKPLAGTVADTVEKYGTGAVNIDGCRIGETGARNNGSKPRDDGFAKNDIYGKYRAMERVDYDKGRFPANCITVDDDAFYSPYFNVSPAELSKKAGKKDRNADWTGAEIDLPERQGGGMQGTVDKTLLTGSGNVRNAVYRNNHPTVKPTELMAWLIRLVTPAGGITLDPFAGSGSTLVAARREGFGFIGIEREAEYISIIEARTGVTQEITDDEFEAMMA